MFLVFIFTMWLGAAYNETGRAVRLSIWAGLILFSLIAKCWRNIITVLPSPLEFRGYFKRFRELAYAGNFVQPGRMGRQADQWPSRREARFTSSGMHVYFNYMKRFLSPISS